MFSLLQLLLTQRNSFTILPLIPKKYIIQKKDEKKIFVNNIRAFKLRITTDIHFSNENEILSIF